MPEQQPDGTIEQQQPTPPERPEWLPQNFKSPEDLASAYVEAQRKITEQGQSLSELEQAVEVLQEQAIAAQQQQDYQGANELEEQLIEALESGDGRQQLGVYAYLAQQAAAQAAQHFQQQFGQQQPQREPDVTAFVVDQMLEARYDDWNNYKAKVAEMIESEPTLLPDLEGLPTERIVVELDRVYQVAKARDVLAAQGDTAEAAAAASRLAKQQALTLTGQSGRPPTMSPNEEYWERIKKANTGSYSEL